MSWSVLSPIWRHKTLSTVNPKSSSRPVAEKTLGKLSAAVEISPYTSKLWGKLYVPGCMQFAQMVPNRTTRSEIKATLWKHVVGSRVQLLVAVKSVSVTSSAGLQHFLLFYIGLKFIFTFCRFSAVEVWRFHLTWVVGMLFSRFRSRNTIMSSEMRYTGVGKAGCYSDRNAGNCQGNLMTCFNTNDRSQRETGTFTKLKLCL